MDHGLDIEKRVRDDLLEIGRRLELPPLVTNDCHYVLQKQAKPHEVMLCVQTGATMDEPTLDNGGRRFAFSGDGYYIKPAEMLREYWDPIVPDGCDNTLWIAERVQDYGEIWEEHPYDRMPVAEVPEGHTPTSWLTHEVMRGLEERFNGGPVPQEYLDRAEYDRARLTFRDAVAAGQSKDEATAAAWRAIGHDLNRAEIGPPTAALAQLVADAQTITPKETP